MPTESKKLRITYRTSSIGVQYDQKDTIRRLGFTKLNQTVEQLDCPTIRGMIHKVRHLVTVKEIDE
jgi:large subunit ribosomal protein L30